MTVRKPPQKGRRGNAQQEFLTTPVKRRRRPADRQHRQEQTLAVSMQAASARKTAKTPARIPAIRLLASVVVLGLVALLGFLFTDNGFYIETAAIRGLQRTSAEAVYQQAGIDQYSIFWIDDRQAARRIEQLPYVKKATVHTALPNHVRIEIEEREPLLVWQVNGRAYWVDREGITMPVAGALPDLPVLWDLDGSTVASSPTPAPGNGEAEPGSAPANRLNQELIVSVRQVKQQVPAVTDFGYDRTHGLQFRFPGGTYVYLGHPEGMAQRVASLLVLHQSLASQGQTPAEINWRHENGYYLRVAR